MIAELRAIGVRTPVLRGALLARMRGTSCLMCRAGLATALLVTVAAMAQLVHVAGGGQSKIQRVS